MIGLLNPGDSGSANITRCNFVGNAASGSGGAIYARPGELLAVVSCTFSDNASSAGGAVRLSAISSLTGSDFVNCVFYDNSAAHGGGMHITALSNPTITNCTFSNNSASSSGGAIYVSSLDSPTISIANCVSWNNSPDEIVNASLSVTLTVDYSDIDGGWSGSGSNNINDDPDFCNPANGNFRLLDGSPCIDVGNDSLVPNDVSDVDDDGNDGETLPWDRAKFTRQFGDDSVVDMGAYENPHYQSCIYDMNHSGVVDLADFSLFLTCFGSPAEGVPCAAADFDCTGTVDLADMALLLAAFGSCGDGFGEDYSEFIQWALQASIEELLDWNREWIESHGG